jgi:predicted acyltransferase
MTARAGDDDARRRQPDAARRRLLALDAFRGLTVAAMILVNNPGAAAHGSAWLRHAEWHGWRFADLIFPAFLVIAGIAIPLSLAAQRAAGASRAALARRILTRTRIIFGLGLLLNALPYFDWDIMRVPGVLQRIALCYGAAAFIALAGGVAGEALAAFALLALYWALLVLVPVPGGGAGVLAPGADLGSYVDRALMGHHLAHGTWDPEGLLSTLPAIATTLIGVLAGEWLLHRRAPSRAAAGLCAAGVACIAIGQLLGLWLPINKSLWTSSFAVFSAGTALLMLAACVWLIDGFGWRRWATPWIIFGSNPILAYGLSSLMTKLLHLIHVRGADGASITLQARIFDATFAPLAPPALASLLYATTYTLLWLAVMAALYRLNVRVKV